MPNSFSPKIDTSKFIDTHCHLNMDSYAEDFQDILERAASNSVEHIISVGIDITSSKAAIELAKEYPQISASIGIHPHDVANINDETYDQLRDLYKNNKDHIVAFGEIGLDYVKNYSPIDVQHIHFRRQIELSLELQLPLIIHCREAQDDLLMILKEMNKELYTGVIHCFSGDIEFAKQVIELGFYISIPGIVTFKNAHDLHRVAEYVPLDKLLIETDGPFLAPMPFRGKRNEPAYVTYTAKKIAELKGVDIGIIAQASTNNAKTLFSIG